MKGNFLEKKYIFFTNLKSFSLHASESFVDLKNFLIQNVFSFYITIT